MTCINFKKIQTLFYKLKKSKLLKQLKKSIENPDDYLQHYNTFLSIFKKYKGKKYDGDKLEEMFNNFIMSKGLKKIEEVVEELKLRDEVKNDNYVVLEIRNRIENTEEQMRTLQELVIKTVEDNKKLKNLVTEKLKFLNNLNEKKQVRNRTTISTN